MQKEERRRKFHESLLNVLYPPQPSAPHQARHGEQPVDTLQNFLNVDIISDEFGESGSPSSGYDESDCGPQKFSRAQRKRLRKKKLKEAASRRKKLIGPLLPTTSPYDALVDLSNEVEGVRCNVAEKLDTGNNEPGEPGACTNQNKRKHRRMAKKLARERSISSTSETLHHDCGPCVTNERLSQE